MMNHYLIIIFFVVASVQSYKIVLNNNQSSPLSIQYVYNGVQSTVTLPGKTAGTPTKWTSSAITVTDSALFSTGNFAAAFVPTSPQAPQATLDVAGSYIAWSPTNPNISMKIYPPSLIPNIVCNDANVIANCKISTFPNNAVSPAKITVPYVTKGQFEIWFNPL